MSLAIDRIEGCLIDLDGTVYQDDRAIDGAAVAIAALRGAGLPFRFTTNTTRMPRAVLAERLTALGVPARAEEILSAPAAAARWLRARGAERVRLLLARATWEDFEGLAVDDLHPQYVVVGDLANEWTFELLDSAFRNLKEGAELVAWPARSPGSRRPSKRRSASRPVCKKDREVSPAPSGAPAGREHPGFSVLSRGRRRTNGGRRRSRRAQEVDRAKALIFLRLSAAFRVAPKDF